MGNSFRPQPAPAIYPPNATPFASDLLEVGLLVAFGMIAASFILIIPGIRGWERLWATIRVFVALWIGAVILLTNFAYTWLTHEVCVRTQYKAYVNGDVPQEIQAEVGLHIGLRGVNVTLHEEACGDETEAAAYYENRPFPGDTIDYNEEFRWADPWAQGRIGFGRFAGRFNRMFRDAQYNGDPYPILWVAEYFTLDGEQIRWGRKFRQAGWYAHQFLWLAFALYLITILLFIWVIGTGGWFMLITGLIMIMASFSFAIIQINDPVLAVPFGDIHGERVLLKPTFGWAWYLNLLTGIATCILAIIVLIMNYFFPRKIAIVFHHSVVEEDEFFVEEEEEPVEGEKPSLEEYVTRGTRRGATTRRGRSQRGLSRYRQTQRKPRSTVRSSRHGGSERLHDEIQLQEVEASEK